MHAVLVMIPLFVCAGGLGSPAINTIDFINISTGGQAMDFGDTTQVGWK